jgi:hypothetical protein
MSETATVRDLKNMVTHNNGDSNTLPTIAFRLVGIIFANQIKSIVALEKVLTFSLDFYLGCDLLTTLQKNPPVFTLNRYDIQQN